jgi:azurin
MSIRITFLAASCALALTACGDKSPSTAETAMPAPATTTAPAATPDPTDTATPAAVATAPGNDRPAAVVTDCATEVEGNDAMQYNVGAITVPASCSEFTINLKHTGQMPVAAMGHNVVITLASDMKAVAADGIGAGIDADYVKADDARVIAYTSMIGGGESTSVTFPVSKINDGGPYEFFCSFPGHSAIMKGVIAVE